MALMKIRQNPQNLMQSTSKNQSPTAHKLEDPMIETNIEAININGIHIREVRV